MANSWQADEEAEEWQLKEPNFRAEEPRKPSQNGPRLWSGPSTSRTIKDMLFVLGIGIGTYALLVITERMISKWLD